MATANEDLVRRLYAGWTADGPPPDLLHEDVEWINPPEAVEAGTRRGREAFAAAFRNVAEAYPDSRVEIQRIVDAGNGNVVVLGTHHMRGRGSGISSVVEQGYVWTIREAKVASFAWFQRHAEALKAAGLDG